MKFVLLIIYSALLAALMIAPATAQPQLQCSGNSCCQCPVCGGNSGAPRCNVATIDDCTFDGTTCAGATDAIKCACTVCGGAETDDICTFLVEANCPANCDVDTCACSVCIADDANTGGDDTCAPEPTTEECEATCGADSNRCNCAACGGDNSNGFCANLGVGPDCTACPSFPCGCAICNDSGLGNACAADGDTAKTLIADCAPCDPDDFSGLCDCAQCTAGGRTDGNCALLIDGEFTCPMDCNDPPPPPTEPCAFCSVPCNTATTVMGCGEAFTVVVACEGTWVGEVCFDCENDSYSLGGGSLVGPNGGFCNLPTGPQDGFITQFCVDGAGNTAIVAVCPEAEEEEESTNSSTGSTSGTGTSASSSSSSSMSMSSMSMSSMSMSSMSMSSSSSRSGRELRGRGMMGKKSTKRSTRRSNGRKRGRSSSKSSSGMAINGDVCGNLDLFTLRAATCSVA